MVPLWFEHFSPYVIQPIAVGSPNPIPHGRGVMPQTQHCMGAFALVAVFVLTSPVRANGTSSPIGFGQVLTDSRHSPVPFGGPPSTGFGQPGARVIAAPPAPYLWPLERDLRDGSLLLNYFDDDSTAGVTDYQGGSHTFDGHAGTDVALYNFRLMDRGYRIVSASAGTVSSVDDAHPDRNVQPPFQEPENRVIVDNGDGSLTRYLHLRRTSIVVQAGESVERGQLLGFAGSSGHSTEPKLHFDYVEPTESGYVSRDPWQGPSQPLPSLWQSQRPYVGDDSLWIADLGVFTQAAAGGYLGSISSTRFKERLTEPRVMGTNEPYLGVFLQLQCQAGDSYRLEILRPDGSSFSAFEYSIPSKVRMGWHYWYWYWSGMVSAADHGTWIARLIVAGSEARRVEFQVGPATIHAPRFEPAGRSFRINSQIQRDTLRLSPLGGPVSLALIGAPAGVSLSGNVVTIDATSNQALRSREFQVVATDSGARTDTMWYHLVDPSKPIRGSDAVPDGPRVTIPSLRGAPNPFTRSILFLYSHAGAARVRLDIYDATGARVRGLLNRGVDSNRDGDAIHWDGRDDRGRRAKPGVYFARLLAGSETRVSRVVLLE
jgi:hypothetical protein